MKKSFRFRKTLLGLGALAAILVVFLLPAESSEARFRCGTKMTFFSDATLSQIVGVLEYTPMRCGCVLNTWGQLTPYRALEDTSCN